VEIEASPRRNILQRQIGRRVGQCHTNQRGGIWNVSTALERVAFARGFFQIGGQQRPHILPVFVVKCRWLHASMLRHPPKNLDPYFNAYAPL
jgi:hypothetical protein